MLSWPHSAPVRALTIVAAIAAFLVVGAVVGLGVVVSMLAGIVAGIGGYLWGPTRRLASPV